MFFLVEPPPQRMIVQMEDIDDFGDDSEQRSYSIPQQTRAIPCTKPIQTKAHINTAAKMIMNKEKSISIPKVDNKPTYVVKTGGFIDSPVKSPYSPSSHQTQNDKKPKVQGRLLGNISDLLKKQEIQDTLVPDRKKQIQTPKESEFEVDKELLAPRVPKRKQVNDNLFNDDFNQDIPQPVHHNNGRKRLLG